MAAPPNVPPAQAPVPPPRKKTSGCLIAAAVAGGILLLLVVVVAVAVARFLGTKEGKAALNVVGEGAKISLHAQSAPGVHEVRKAGCAQAAVMDADDLRRLAELIDQDASSQRAPPPASVLVSCKGDLLRTPPSCDDVLHAYIAAVPAPPGRVLVQVVGATEQRPRCSNLYEADGTFVGNTDTR
jgi:hypothetical protein